MKSGSVDFASFVGSNMQSFVARPRKMKRVSPGESCTVTLCWSVPLMYRAPNVDVMLNSFGVSGCRSMLLRGGHGAGIILLLGSVWFLCSKCVMGPSCEVAGILRTNSKAR
mgnify:CR=1 FL=1